ncbi:uncharacterized protein EV154DRAFT_386665, partial [Mucor mucedo]|uniref:uncharacterized protein n=1 Tax=Mucor mucedo TaxID=29922 RepID=UPI002220DE91
MLTRHPFLQQDFFRRPLEENDRRRFLYACSKNTLPNYDPSKLNKVQVIANNKHTDSQL